MDGDGYEKLCPFLNLPIYNSSFPRKNIRKNLDFKKLDSSSGDS